ncbi:MAG: DUF2784 family protein [Spirochaetales bacterium]|nr:DUF2784 family protein [Spirochaetales bacterium]
MFIYQFLDIFFIVFHTFYTLFCTLGWIWKKTRKLNLILLLLTTISWFGLGYFCGLGPGYCLCTDWHWQVKIKLGYRNIPRSYIKYLVDQLTGLNLDSTLVDTVVMILYILAMIFSIALNTRDFILKRRSLK